MLTGKEFIILYCSTSSLAGRREDMPSWFVSIETVANIPPGSSKAVFLESNPESCSVIYVACLAIARSVSKTLVSNKCTHIQSNPRKELGSLGWSNYSLDDLGISVTTDQDCYAYHMINPWSNLEWNTTWLYLLPTMIRAFLSKTPYKQITWTNSFPTTSLQFTHQTWKPRMDIKK